MLSHAWSALLRLAYELFNATICTLSKSSETVRSGEVGKAVWVDVGLWGSA